MRPAIPCMLAVVLLGARPVVAQPREPPPHVAVQLSFHGTPACPDEEFFHLAVSSRLGYDPFVSPPEGAPVVTLRLKRVGGMFSGAYTLRDADGESAPEGYTDSQCKRLIQSLAIAVSGVVGPPIVPPRPARPAGPAQQEPAPAPPVPVPVPVPVPAPAPVAPPMSNVQLLVGLYAIYNAFLASKGMAGVAPTLAIQLRHPALSFEVAMQAAWTLAPAGVQVPADVPTRWTYVSGVLAVCVHGHDLFGGPVLEVGRLAVSTAGLYGMYPTADPLLVAMGLRGGAEKTFANVVILHGFVQGEYVAAGPRILADLHLHEAQVTPAFSFTAALGIAFRLR